MKKSILASIFLFSFFIAKSQSIKFDKIYVMQNEFELNNFQQTSDGGYILCTDTPPEQDTAVVKLGYGYLIKMDHLGTTQWIKKFVKTNFTYKSYDGNSVVQTADGGYMIGTTIYLNSNPQLFGGSTFIYLIKTDGSGNVIWSKMYAGQGNASCFCVKQTSDLGYIVCGSTTDTILNKQYNYLLKTDQEGNSQWGKFYAEVASGQGNNSYCVSQTSDGGYIMTGESFSGSFVMKTDNAGNIIWNNNFGGSGSDILYNAIQTSDHGFIATGYGYESSNGILGTILLKFDSAGMPQWKNIYTSSTSSGDEGFAVIEIPTGYVVLETLGNPHPALLKTDFNGNYQSTTEYHFGLSYVPSGLVHTSDGGYAFSSIYGDNFRTGVEAIKTDSLFHLNCGDSSITIYDTTYSPQPNAAFVASSIFPFATVNTVFNSITMTDSLVCPATIDDGIPNFPNENSIFIFPNPSSGNFSLEINSMNGKNIQVEIYGLLGEKVLEKNTGNVSGNYSDNFSLEEMPEGIYFVEVKVDGKIVGTKKIVRED